MSKLIKFTSFETVAMKSLRSKLGTKPYELLDAEEERKLAMATALGDAKAREELIRRNMRLVVTVAKRYQGIGGFTLDDLVCYGFEGLVKAADRYDYKRGVRFANFAYFWIASSIMSGINKDVFIRMPQRIGVLRSKVRKLMARYEAENGCRISDDELAVAMDITDDTLRMVLKENLRWSSIDVPLSDEQDSDTIANMLEADESYDADKYFVLADEYSRVMAFIEVVLSKRDAHLLVDYTRSDRRMLPLVANKYGLTIDELKVRAENCNRRLKKAGIGRMYITEAA